MNYFNVSQVLSDYYKLYFSNWTNTTLLDKYTYNIRDNIEFIDKLNSNPNSMLLTQNVTSGIKLVYNIDATGAGKHVLFRSNSKWLLKQYSQCSIRPFAHSIANAMLEFIEYSQRTDVTTYGHHMHAIDHVSLSDHWIYHTALDDDYKIAYTDGVLQFDGENALSCIEHLSKLKDIPDSGYDTLSTKQESIVYPNYTYYFENVILGNYYDDTQMDSDRGNMTVFEHITAAASENEIDNFNLYPEYPHSPNVNANVLFYSILMNSMIIIDFDTLMVRNLIFSLVGMFWCCFYCFRLKSRINLRSATVDISISYSKLFCTWITMVCLLLANFIIITITSVGVANAMKDLRPQKSPSPSCSDCFGTTWRGLEALFVCTLSAVSLIICVFTQWIVEKLISKYDKYSVLNVDGLNSSIDDAASMHLDNSDQNMIESELNHDQLSDTNSKIDTGTKFTIATIGEDLAWIALVGYVSLLTLLFTLISVTNVASIGYHLSYLPFWWLVSCLTAHWIGLIVNKILPYKNCNVKFCQKIKKDYRFVALLWIKYSIGFLFPLLVTFEFCVLFVPDVLGFENWLSMTLIGGLGGVCISFWIIPLGLLMRRIKHFKYQCIFSVVMFVLLFLLAVFVNANKMLGGEAVSDRD